MDTKKLQWVFEQINARRNPMTEEQLDRFCLNPNGPLLPEGLVEAKRPPANDGETCIDVAVDPTGTPCYVFKSRERSQFRIVHGDQTWVIGYKEPSKSAEVLKAITDAGELAYRARVIGFDQNVMPITKVRFKCYIDSDVTTNLPELLFRGDQPLWDPQQEQWTVLGIDVQRNICLVKPINADWVTFRNLETWEVCGSARFKGWTHFEQAFIASDSESYVLGHAPGGESRLSIGRRGHEGVTTTWSKLGGFTLNVCDHTYELLVLEELVHLVCSRGRGDRYTKLFALVGDEWKLCEQVSESAYLRGLQRMKNGSWAYVGKPTRHDGECYFVDDKEHPRFLSVSRLFLRDGYWHYYGLTMDGRHVCLMHL